MLDKVGREIVAGDYIAYPGKWADRLEMRVYKVLEVRPAKPLEERHYHAQGEQGTLLTLECDIHHNNAGDLVLDAFERKRTLFNVKDALVVTSLLEYVTITE